MECGDRRDRGQAGGRRPEARAEYEKRIEELSEEVEAAMHKLEELKRAGSPAWQTSAENWGEGM